MRMTELLSKGGEGVFMWLEEIVGREKAVDLAKNGAMPYQGLSSSGEKRKATSDSEGSDDDIELPFPLPSGSKRIRH